MFREQSDNLEWDWDSGVHDCTYVSSILIIWKLTGTLLYRKCCSPLRIRIGQT